MKYKTQYARFNLVEKGEVRSCRIYLRMIAEYEYYFRVMDEYRSKYPEVFDDISPRVYLRETAKKYCSTINYTYANIASLASLGEKRMRSLERRAISVLR